MEPLEDRRLLAVFTVDNLSDAGLGSLRQAIADANANIGADIVEFQAGLSGTIALSSGEMTITDDLTIDGPGAAALTIDAQQNSRIFNISTISGPVTLNGLHLTGGSAGSRAGAIFSATTAPLTVNASTISGNTARGVSVRGGGIFASGDVTVTGSTIADNYAAGPSRGAYGGGIYAAGDVTITGSTISGNTVTGNSRAVYGLGAVGGGVYAKGDVTITGSTISGNSANSDSSYVVGGGIYTRGGVTVSDTTISGNSANSDLSGAGAGGIRARGDVTVAGSMISDNSVAGDATNFPSLTFAAHAGGIRTSGDLTLTDSIVSGNSATGIGGDAVGGGLSAFRGQVTVTDSMISGNSATSDLRAKGGGIFTFGNVTVSNSTISGNSAVGDQASGGGIRASGDVRVTSSTISGNAASGVESGWGGGIYTDGSFRPDLTVSSSTISGNSATGDESGGGGGIYGGGQVTVANSTTSGNSATGGSLFGGLRHGGGGGIWVNDRPLTIENSIVASNSTDDGTFTDLNPGTGPLTVRYSLIGTAASPIDPLLGPLQDNGGPTFTHALLPGSPAINAGDSAFAPPPDFDQRGDPFDRVVDGRIDMGAFEVQLPPEADIAIVSSEVLNAPAEIDVSDQVDITLRKVVTNHGPAPVVDALVTSTAIAHQDCDVTPASLSQPVLGLQLGEQREVFETFTIHCSQPSFHTFDFTNFIEVTTPDVTDPDLNNNPAVTSLTVAAIAQADLEIVDWDLSAAPDELIVSQPFAFPTTKIVRNNGDTVNADVVGLADFTDHGTGPLQTNFFQSEGIIFTAGSFVSVVQSDGALIGIGDTIGTIAGVFTTPANSVSVRVAPALQGTATYTLSTFDASSTLVASQSVTITQDTGDPENTGFGYFTIDLDNLPTAASSFTIENTFVRSSGWPTRIDFGVSEIAFGAPPFSDPVDTTVTKTMVVPAGIEGSVHVNDDLNPSVEIDGVVVPIPPDGIVTAVGPATLSVEFAVLDMTVSEETTFAETFGIHCLEQGRPEITLRNEIRANDPHVQDPNPDNNIVEITHAVDCLQPPTLDEKIQELMDTGVLNRGQANSLLVKLNPGGNEQAQVNRLGAFINEVNAFVGAGTLSAEEGQSLIDAAESLRTSLSHVGDANGDGVVDAGDYTAWANQFDKRGPEQSADFNSDGVVDAGDYTAWANNFGVGATTSAAPAVAPLAVMEDAVSNELESSTVATDSVHASAEMNWALYLLYQDLLDDETDE